MELEATDKQVREYYISDDTMKLTVAKGDTVEAKQIIGKSKESKQKIQTTHAGRVIKVTDTVVTIEDLIPEKVAYEVPAGRNILVKANATCAPVGLAIMQSVAPPCSLWIMQPMAESLCQSGPCPPALNHVISSGR